MAASTALNVATNFEPNNTIIACVPILKGPISFPIWSVHMQSVLQSLSVWGFIDRTCTFVNTIIGNQEKWKVVNKRVCGIIANTLTDALVHNVSYDYANLAICISVSKTVWDRMTALFASHGLAGQFHMFHQAQRVTVRPQTVSEDINHLTNLFNQIAAANLTLPESFKVMFILEQLPTEFYNFCSTVALTTEPAQFMVDTIMTKILAEVSMLSSKCSLKSHISQVETTVPEVHDSSVNWMSVIQKGPPNFNKWRPQRGSAPTRGSRLFAKCGGSGCPNFQKRPSFFSEQKDKNCAGFEMRKNKGKGKAPQGQVHMIEREQGEGFIYEIVTDSNTLGHIEEIMDTDLNEATLASPFKGVKPLGARDPDYNVKMYEENANVWESGSMDTGMDNVHPHHSFQHHSPF